MNTETRIDTTLPNICNGHIQEGSSRTNTLAPVATRKTFVAKKKYSSALKRPDNPYPKFYLYHRIVQAKLFIDRNYGSTIDLHNIANAANFSKFHFIRLFTSIYGKTPHQYLIQVRIDNAKQLLQDNHSVSDSCYMVGFDSITSFTGLFRKSTGSTPSAYQKQYQLRQASIKARPLSFIPNCFAEQKGWTRNSNFQELT